MALSNAQLAALLTAPDSDAHGQPSLVDTNAILSELIDRVIAFETRIAAIEAYVIAHP